MVIFFTLFAEQFFMHFPLIAGSTLSLSLLKLPDLSLETAFVCGALVSSKIATITPYTGIYGFLLLAFVSLSAGGAVGLCSSSLTTHFAIAHLLSSILTFGTFQAVYYLIGRYISLAHAPQVLQSFFKISSYVPIPQLGIIFLGCVLIITLFYRTQLAYCMTFYGLNPNMLSYYKIKSHFIIISGVAIANSLAGFSGFLVAQSTGFADSSMGYGKILVCITSILLGKLFLPNTNHSPTIPLVGSAAYFFLQQMLIHASINLNYLTAIQAFIIIMLLAYRSARLNQVNVLLGI